MNFFYYVYILLLSFSLSPAEDCYCIFLSILIERDDAIYYIAFLSFAREMKTKRHDHQIVT